MKKTLIIWFKFTNEIKTLRADYIDLMKEIGFKNVSIGIDVFEGLVEEISELEQVYTELHSPEVQDAIGKQFSKKPLDLYKENTSHDKEVLFGSCPNLECGRYISSDFKYCPNCGQKLDWVDGKVLE